MKISTKGRYALRMMLDIAVHDTGEPVRIRDIAARQEISVKYLEQIVSVLARAGYVKSIRGPQGGYRLTRNLLLFSERSPADTPEYLWDPPLAKTGQRTVQLLRQRPNRHA